MDHLTVSHAFYYNEANESGVLYGLAYRDGARFNRGLAPSVEEARTEAQALADAADVPVEMFDALSMTRKREQERQQDQERQQRLAEEAGAYKHMAAVVTGKVEEAPMVIAGLDEIEVDPDWVAIPTLGGIITEAPASRVRFPETVQHPVSRALTHNGRQAGGWVLCEYNGGACAMPAIFNNNPEP